MVTKHTVVDRGSSPLRLTINFHEVFPVAKRSIIRRSAKASLRLLALLVTLVATLCLIHVFWSPLEEVLAYKWAMVAGIVVLAFAVFAAKIVYEFKYRETLEFGITRHNFYLKRGVFMQDTGSFPLSRITDIYLERRMSDYLLGLASLVIATPSNKSVDFARIEGLKFQDAQNLKFLLSSVVHSGPGSLSQEPLFLDVADKNGLTIGELKILLLEEERERWTAPATPNRQRELLDVSSAA
ncbi:MAG: PH domain-containing protein [Bdellovibrionales bacterium]|nr:PH domain-containing protein [Bdellovibrionales bacterium]